MSEQQLEKIDEGKTNSQKDCQVYSLTKTEFFLGPLPHPAILQGYEQVCNGAANRIIKLAENQAKHRQKIEKRITTSSIKNERIAMFLSFSLTIVIVIIGAILLIAGKEVAGYISIFGPSAFQAGNYILSKKNQSKEDNPKDTQEVKKEPKKNNQKISKEKKKKRNKKKKAKR